MESSTDGIRGDVKIAMTKAKKAVRSRLKDLEFFRSAVRRRSALPDMRGHGGRTMRAQPGCGKFDECYRQGNKWNGGQKEWTVMGHGLAEGAIQGIVVKRRLGRRMGEYLGDRSRCGAVDVGLGDVRLQRKSEQDQAGDETPA
jgi:hypothetical protein